MTSTGDKLWNKFGNTLLRRYMRSDQSVETIAMVLNCTVAQVHAQWAILLERDKKRRLQTAQRAAGTSRVGKQSKLITNPQHEGMFDEEDGRPVVEVDPLLERLQQYHGHERRTGGGQLIEETKS